MRLVTRRVSEGLCWQSSQRSGPRLRFGFPVLSVNDIDGCRFEVVVGVYPSDASSFCPPIVSAWVECIQASCCVCFQINACLCRRCVTGRYQYMNMIRSELTACRTQPRCWHVSLIWASIAHRWSFVRRIASSLIRDSQSASRLLLGSCQPCLYSTQPRASPGSQVPYVTHVRKNAIGESDVMEW